MRTRGFQFGFEDELPRGGSTAATAAAARAALPAGSKDMQPQSQAQPTKEQQEQRQLKKSGMTPSMAEAVPLP